MRRKSGLLLHKVRFEAQICANQFFSILINQNKRKMKTHYSRCLSIKQALMRVALRQQRVRGAAYFRKLDVFIALISMTTEYFVSGGGKYKQ